MLDTDKDGPSLFEATREAEQDSACEICHSFSTLSSSLPTIATITSTTNLIHSLSLAGPSPPTSSQTSSSTITSSPKFHHHSHHRYLHRFRHARAHDHSFQSRHSHKQRSLPQERDSTNNNNHRGDDDILLDNRDVGGDPSSSFVTKVVQTISHIEIVDYQGHPLQTQTLYAEPATVVVDPATGNTVEISSPNISATNAVPGSNPAASHDVSPQATLSAAGMISPASSSSSSSSSTLTGLSMPSPSPSPPQSSSTNSTSAATSATSAMPSANTATNLALNSTMSALLNQNSTHSPSGTKLDKTFLPLDMSTTSHSGSHSMSSSHYSFDVSSTASYETKSTTSHSSTITASTSTYDGTTVGGYGNGDGELTEGGAQPTADSEPSSSDGDDSEGLSPQQKSIVGGVVGSVAGLAFLLLLAMMAIKYRRRSAKRAQGAISAAAAGSGGARGLGAGSANGTGGGDGGAADQGRPPMAESSNPSSGVAAALAALSGKRKARDQAQDGEGGAERGFYRVSGRKLPSVLTAGGDGYTDPRMSTLSGETDYYRGSQAFDPISGGSTRLALGSPMRPVSGVPIMRTGPGRTPQAEQNPFADPPSPPNVQSPRVPSPNTGLGLQPGRLPATQGPPRSSSSRFHEGV